ncbi:MAG: Bax inhibitor-1/YccA family protein [Acidimicrobiales bacterium]
MESAAPQYTAPVITLGEDARIAFMMKVYQHIGLAIAAFIGIEFLLFTSGAAEWAYDFLAGSGGAWLLFLGLFMVGSFIAAQATSDLSNPGRQYAGLFGTAALEALIFAPFLWYVFKVQDSANDVWIAAVITAMGFVALSAVAWVTRRDLSFIRPLVMWGGVAALLLIVSSLLFGWHLGTWFSVAMIAVAGGAILYTTQKALRSYPEQAYVAAAVQLFAALMTMFWYVLRIFSDS